MSAQWSGLFATSAVLAIWPQGSWCITRTHTHAEEKPNTPDHIPGPLRWMSQPEKNRKRRMWTAQGERAGQIFPAVALTIIRQNTGEASRPSITRTATPRKELVSRWLQAFIWRKAFYVAPNIAFTHALSLGRVMEGRVCCLVTCRESKHQSGSNTRICGWTGERLAWDKQVIKSQRSIHCWVVWVSLRYYYSFYSFF